MTSEQIEEARALLAWDDWEWVPGMRTASGWRVVSVELDMVALDHPRESLRHETQESLSATEIPDLTDFATQGCLLLTATGGPALDAEGVTSLVQALLTLGKKRPPRPYTPRSRKVAP